jgi:hypothetical protein
LAGSTSRATIEISARGVEVGRGCAPLVSSKAQKVEIHRVRFWIHRVLQSEGVESHDVDAASIATSRRRRRAKTDIDGEALVRALLAYKRCEPRVCAMVRTPTPEEEDRRDFAVAPIMIVSVV